MMLIRSQKTQTTDVTNIIQILYEKQFYCIVIIIYCIINVAVAQILAM